ncbi:MULTISPECIES: alpha-glucoside-specific PTS transporter subunit IIBC [unclassified Brenneria]|uniref:alpha-glucoside-specific PTS transporter subunit IIBC n=1 Tax=unclassified Brenneria TaxID=2634434 RepID=UPI00155580D8|nr:alpha-glucoside-specific PTS transporter subunit IIBC [Brenneria sp. hezel4-2-4]MEE3650306.1 alpha-glucoside-specific PTS transporter subunit IIBC [Brenneria sp. HEZEL_4_2_4]NPD00262.1 PTS transporter subunit EIIC [Brenneria sp. hezel4-2-4]
MLSQIQRFGGAMFTPVLLFPFAGIIVGIAIVLSNPMFVGELANPDSLFFQIVNVIEEGGWTIFRNMPLIFAVSLPIGLADRAPARACLASLVSYLTFNYLIQAMATQWGGYFNVDFSVEVGGVSGLTTIAGIKTLDTSIIGAIAISGLITAIHNRFYEKILPVYLGIFQGTAYVTMISFLIMIPAAWLTLLIWPKIQMGISSLQDLMLASGALGVWVYTFLERILIPTGLHHFIYGPFIFGPAAVENGIQISWIEHIQAFSQSTLPLKELFPVGGFALHGNSKIFGAIGIAAAIYSTASAENKSKIAGLLIPAALTSALVGISEPLEFTFLFIAPFLFAIHAILAATMATIMYMMGIVGNMGGGLIEIVTQNWLPMFHHHAMNMVLQIGIGVAFSFLYFLIFRSVILRFNIKTPGREDSEVKLYYKADLRNKQANQAVVQLQQAQAYLDALGGTANIVTLANCATRLRITLADPALMQPDEVFRQLGAHGVVRNSNAIQIIVGLSVPQVRDRLENLMQHSRLTEVHS